MRLGLLRSCLRVSSIVVLEIEFGPELILLTNIWKFENRGTTHGTY